MSSALSPALIAQIDHLVEKYEQGHNLVKIGQQILELLRSEGHVQRLTLPPKCVGVHPANRDGMGISARDCHGLLDDIIAIGFVSNRVHAVATEVCSTVLMISDCGMSGLCPVLGAHLVNAEVRS